MRYGTVQYREKELIFFWTYIKTTLNIELHISLETFCRMLMIIEVLVVPSQAVPSSSKAIPCGRFEITKRSARVMSDKLWKSTGPREGSTHSNSLCDVEGHLLTRLWCERRCKTAIFTCDCNGLAIRRINFKTRIKPNVFRTSKHQERQSRQEEEAVLDRASYQVLGLTCWYAFNRHGLRPWLKIDHSRHW